MSVLAQQWVTLDGYAAGPAGEQDVFAFIPPDGEDAANEHNVRLLDGIDIVLLGRRTYESFVQVWPTLDHPMAPLVNAVPKVVCSRTLRVAPWPGYDDARVVTDAAAFVRSASGAVLVWGSLAVQHDLMAAGLLDELEVFVAPGATGQGRPLLPPGLRVGLLQLNGDVWPAGVTRLRYKITSQSAVEGPGGVGPDD